MAGIGRARLLFIRSLKECVKIRKERLPSYQSLRKVSQCSQHVVGSMYREQTIPVTNLAEFVMKDWHRYGDKMAVKCVDTGRSYTYSQLNDAVHKLANSLTQLGIRKGDVVFLLSSNIPEYPVVYLATIAIGAVLTANNPAYTSSEVAQSIALSEAKLIFTTSEQLPTVKLALDSLQGKHSVQETIVLGKAAGYRPISALLEGDFSQTNYLDLDYKNHIAVLPFSSGTTGLPKGVMLSHNNILSNIVQISNSGMTVGYEDTLAGVLPFFHIYGQVATLLLGLASGASIVLLEKFDFIKFLKMIEEEDVTLAHLVPPIILPLIKSNLTEDYDLSSLRLITSGAAPLKRQLSLQFAEKMPKIDLLQGYGLTETSPVVTFSEPGHRNKHGSVGLLMANCKAKVVDLDTGKSLPVNQEGELYFYGPNVMKGYWKNEEATKDCLDGSWFRTGDIGYYDETGHFYVVDRLKELIKYKGFQVAPAELESVLIAHPKILDAAVVSIPSDEAGELPRAYVVVKPGQSATDEEIHQYMERHVSKHKQLRGGIRQVKEIPKSAAGKILRRILKQQALDDM